MVLRSLAMPGRDSTSLNIELAQDESSTPFTMSLCHSEPFHHESGGNSAGGVSWLNFPGFLGSLHSLLQVKNHRLNCTEIVVSNFKNVYTFSSGSAGSIGSILEHFSFVSFLESFFLWNCCLLQQLGFFCAFSCKILIVNDALACSFINFIQNWEKSFYGYLDEMKFSSENLMVYEFITWSFLDMCLFIVLFVKYWNDKNHLILFSIKLDLCFDKKFFLFNSPDVVHFKVWSFLLFLFLLSFYLQNAIWSLLMIYRIEPIFLCFSKFFSLDKEGTLLTDCSET
jgi:hypothetical protein